MFDFLHFLNKEKVSYTKTAAGLAIDGLLDLRGTGITALPEGLTVGGEVYH